MIRETYFGRKIKVVRGKGRDLGFCIVTLNGAPQGRWMGDEPKVLNRIKANIEEVAKWGIDGNSYGIPWYDPSTVEDCGNGHAREVGGLCRHSWCVSKRNAA